MLSCTISKFGLKEATECAAALRKIGQNCTSMEDVSKKVVQYIFDLFVDETTTINEFALVRLFKTHDFGGLDTELKHFAEHCFSDQVVVDKTKCLTLLATTGTEEKWKSRTSSNGHKAIPLSSEEIVNKLPMILNLIKQLGLDIQTVIKPDPELIQDLTERSYNVFLVPEAEGSPNIPAQDEFVVPFCIKSVLGFGGVLPDGDVFAVIIFSKKKITDNVAVLFKTIALSVKVSLLPFTGKTFA